MASRYLRHFVLSTSLWLAQGRDLLQPLSTAAPDSRVFEASPVPHQFVPIHANTLDGPKATNKFWTNWAVASGTELPIFPMPYALKLSPAGSRGLQVSHGDQVPVYSTQAGDVSKVSHYSTPFVCEYALGAVEATQAPSIVNETLFGIQVHLSSGSSPNRNIMYPIFSGMAYVSGRFEGGFTPRITSDRAITLVERLRNGTWRFLNNGGVEFRVYALSESGEFVDASFDFDAGGRMNKQLDGWIRMARVLQGVSKHGDTLDAHAQAILLGVELEVSSGGSVRYDFLSTTREGTFRPQVLHFAYAHQLKLFASAPRKAPGAMRSPSKGLMTPVAGNTWILQANVSAASELGFLPLGDQASEHKDFLAAEALGTLQWFLEGGNWKSAMFKGTYYFSGKGFQKVAMVCLMMEKFYGQADSRTQACAQILADGFRCLYDAASTSGCQGAPRGSYYDASWGGIASKDGFQDDGCLGGADFGNACYNDHHYHFGYFVVSAAVLVKLAPQWRDSSAFVDFVDTLIRDTTNPSKEDRHFPLFRSFDWFDLHSWSRGVVPSADGKDQESTSEELNLLYGIHLWGSATRRVWLQELGATMLALAATSVQEFFLMKRDNPHHHPDFVKNHVTGIFFQNKVHYTTWFGAETKYIHGIQMLPLSPALRLSRTREFCAQEWEDVLAKLPLSTTDPWTSILLSGGLALFDPGQAYKRLLAMSPDHMDDGLTRAWALYWAAVQAGSLGNDSHAQTSTAPQVTARSLTTTTSTTTPRSTTPETIASSSTTSATPHCPASCSSPLHPACKHLAGYCCPSLNGTMSSCCAILPTTTYDQLGAATFHSHIWTVSNMFMLLTALFCHPP